MKSLSTAVLADRLALAIVEHGPASGSDLAIRVAARKTTVLRELQEDARFECLGSGRGSRWRLAGNRIDPRREPMGTEASDGRGETLAEQLLALEARVAELERVLAETRVCV